MINVDQWENHYTDFIGLNSNKRSAGVAHHGESGKSIAFNLEIQSRRISCPT